MAEMRPTYKSFILRLWPDDASGATWRARLESVARAGEVYYFADLDSLFAFLLALSEASSAAADAAAASHSEHEAEGDTPEL